MKEEMEWRPIAEYDAMEIRPKHAAFLFEETEPKRPGGGYLIETVELTRVFGSRVCTHFVVLPKTPEAP